MSYCETMDFFNENRLRTYQIFLGSNCACCRSTVWRTSQGKYCGRFGSCIECLEEFKKGSKVCRFCQKDIGRLTIKNGSMQETVTMGVARNKNRRSEWKEGTTSHRAEAANLRTETTT